MPDINGIPYVESTDLVSAYPAASQALAQEISDQLASKLPYSYGTATPSTTDSGFLWYDSNSTPAATKFWDGSAFVPFGGKILQVVRATDSTNRSTTSTTLVDASLSVTITPNKSDSAVILLWTCRIATGNNLYAKFAITDNSNNQLSGAQAALVGGNGAGTFAAPLVLVGYSTPATTSATTYKARFQTDSSGTAYIQNAETTGQLYAIEVSA